MRYVYLEYATGERELYDLVDDPYQLENLYDAADPGLLEWLALGLAALRTCQGASCPTAEDALGFSLRPVGRRSSR